MAPFSTLNDTFYRVKDTLEIMKVMVCPMVSL